MPMKVYGFEELNAMTGEELIKAYNRVAERVNKRITRAGGVAKAGQARMPVLRSDKAKAQFLSTFKQNARMIIEEIMRNDIARLRLTNAKLTGKTADYFKDEVRRTIRQSYAGEHLHGDYRGEWLDTLSAGELASIKSRVDRLKYQYADTRGGLKNVLWYIYRKSHIIGGEHPAMASKELFMQALKDAEEVNIAEMVRYAGKRPEEITKMIAKQVKAGQWEDAQ